MHVGFIGTGTMGRLLIESFIAAGTFKPSQIYASNRTYDKVKALAKAYPGMHAYPSNDRVARHADLLFLCVKPTDYKTVIDEIKQEVHGEQIIVSITSPVPIGTLETHLNGKIAKVIPSITNAAGKGASLIIAGQRLKWRDKELLFSLMQTISQPLWLEERFTRVCSDMVSCGPAFFSCLLERMAVVAERETGISSHTAIILLNHMLTGLAALLATDQFTLTSLQEKVAVPGGVTAVGLEVLKNQADEMFQALFRATHQKHAEDVQKAIRLFDG